MSRVRLNQYCLKAQLIWDLFDPSQLGRYRRLARPVDGWLSRDEEEVLFRLSRAVPRTCCTVELGAWLGRSAIILGGGSKRGNGAAVFSIDTFRAADDHKFLVERAGELARDYLNQFHANIDAAGLSTVVTAVRSDTSEMGLNWSGPPVGLLFIDADHAYEAVRRDWTSWQGRLAPDGTVAFHDYQNPDGQVTQFVDEQVATGRLELIEQRGSIFVGKIRHGDTPP